MIDTAKIRKEVARWKEGNILEAGTMSGYVLALADEVDALRRTAAENTLALVEALTAERDEARKTVDDLRPLLEMASSIKTAFENGHHSICVYCGEKVDGGLLTDRSEIATLWKAHSAICTKSLLGEMRARAEKAEAERDALLADTAAVAARYFSEEEIVAFLVDVRQKSPTIAHAMVAAIKERRGT